MLRNFLSDRYFLLILFFSAAYFGFWILYQSVSFATFQPAYYDIGIVLSSMYAHVSNVQLANPMQYLVFYGHIAPFSLLLVPIFALFPYPITMFAIQEIFLMLTTLLIYFVTAELTKRRLLAFIFSVAFMLSPLIVGALYFGFHNEAFVPFFAILAFYSYMRNDSKLFFASYILLLSVLELTFVVGLALLIALFAYELMYATEKSGAGRESKRRMLVGAMGLSVFAALGYYFLTSYITGTYAQTSFQVIPPIVRLPGYYITGQLQNILAPNAVSNQFVANGVGIIGTTVLFLGFGLLSLAAPIISLILYSPWLVEVFVVHNYSFVYFSYQYYALVAGSSLISAVLGYMIITKHRKNWLSRLIIRKRGEARIVMTSVILAAYASAITFVYLAIFASGLTPQQMNYTQIERVLAGLPTNASVMAQGNLAPHLYRTRSLELAPPDSPIWFTKTNITVFWTKPDYIVLDNKLPYYNDLVNYSFNVYAYMDSNYSTYYSSSGLYVFKRTR